MIRLTATTTDLLRVTPTSANEVKVIVDFSDKSTSAYTGGNQATTVAAASITTICATPAASTIRDIDHVSLCATGGANTLTIQQTVSGTGYQLTQAVLAANETLEYTHAGGWRTLDANGQLKLIMPGYLPLTGGTISGVLTLSAALTYGGVALTNAVTGTGKMVLDTSPTIATPIINSAAHVGGTWVADATWTLPALTLGGTISGGGNQINNVIIGTVTPLAISGTTGTFSGLLTRTSTGVGQNTKLVTTGTAGFNAITFEDANPSITHFGAIGVTTTANKWFLGGGSSPGTLATVQALLWDASGVVTIPSTLNVNGTTINMVTSGTTLTVGVGADNGTVSAGVFTDRTKAFTGDALTEIKKVKAVAGHIDHATLPAFARENVKKQVTDAEGNITEVIEVERNIGAMVSILTVAVQELDARIKSLEK